VKSRPEKLERAFSTRKKQAAQRSAHQIMARKMKNRNSVIIPCSALLKTLF
jgi:hypothetical protein